MYLPSKLSISIYAKESFLVLKKNWSLEAPSISFSLKYIEILCTNLFSMQNRFIGIPYARK